MLLFCALAALSFLLLTRELFFAFDVKRKKKKKKCNAGTNDEFNTDRLLCMNDSNDSLSLSLLVLLMFVYVVY